MMIQMKIAELILYTPLLISLIPGIDGVICSRLRYDFHSNYTTYFVCTYGCCGINNNQYCCHRTKNYFTLVTACTSALGLALFFVIVFCIIIMNKKKTSGRRSNAVQPMRPLTPTTTPRNSYPGPFIQQQLMRPPQQFPVPQQFHTPPNRLLSPQQQFRASPQQFSTPPIQFPTPPFQFPTPPSQYIPLAPSQEVLYGEPIHRGPP